VRLTLDLKGLSKPERDKGNFWGWRQTLWISKGPSGRQYEIGPPDESGHILGRGDVV
jgi:hypothetical protein